MAALFSRLKQLEVQLAERDYDAPVRDTETGWLGHLFLPLAVLAGPLAPTLALALREGDQLAGRQLAKSIHQQLFLVDKNARLSVVTCDEAEAAQFVISLADAGEPWCRAGCSALCTVQLLVSIVGPLLVRRARRIS